MSKPVFYIPVELYTDKSYNNLRRSILLLLADILETYTEDLPFDKKSNIIISIEKSVYNKVVNKNQYKKIWCPSFEYQYRLYVNKITKNLDTTSEVKSNYLIDKIINDEIDIDNISDLNSDALCPEKNDLFIKRLHTRLNQKINTKTSSLYTCKNCKKKEVIIKEIQIRRIDEATSVSATCVFCNYNWIA